MCFWYQIFFLLFVLISITLKVITFELFRINIFICGCFFITTNTSQNCNSYFYLLLMKIISQPPPFVISFSRYSSLCLSFGIVAYVFDQFDFFYIMLLINHSDLYIFTKIAYSITNVLYLIRNSSTQKNQYHRQKIKYHILY